MYNIVCVWRPKMDCVGKKKPFMTGTRYIIILSTNIMWTRVSNTWKYIPFYTINLEPNGTNNLNNRIMEVLNILNTSSGDFIIPNFNRTVLAKSFNWYKFIIIFFAPIIIIVYFYFLKIVYHRNWKIAFKAAV